MEHRDEIGFQIRRLSRLVKRLVDNTAFSQGEDKTTGMHGWIIGYLYENRGRDVYQRDIQEQFSVRRSTVTRILQLMGKNGLITRRTVAHDARLKKLELTPKAIQQHERIVDGIRSVEDRISRCLTPEERDIFLGLCEKIAVNLEDGDRQKSFPPGKQGET